MRHRVSRKSCELKTPIQFTLRCSRAPQPHYRDVYSPITHFFIILGPLRVIITVGAANAPLGTYSACFTCFGPSLWISVLLFEYLRGTYPASDLESLEMTRQSTPTGLTRASAGQERSVDSCAKLNSIGIGQSRL